MNVLLLGFVVFGAAVSGASLTKRKWHHQGLGSPPFPRDSEAQVPEDQWFIQILDHFRPSDDRTW